MEGTCNFIYLVGKGSLKLYAKLQLIIVKRDRVVIQYIRGMEIQILHFITLFIVQKDLAYKRNINNLLLNRFLKAGLHFQLSLQKLKSTFNFQLKLIM